MAVWKFLQKDGHFTAEEVYAQLKPSISGFSLATVYSILNILTQKGLVEELRIDFERSYFEVKKEMHHHFFCRYCARVWDEHIPLCKTLKTRSVEGHIEDAHGYFYGVCRQCQKKRRK